MIRAGSRWPAGEGVPALARPDAADPGRRGCVGARSGGSPSHLTRRRALSANIGETVPPWEFSVEGESGSEADEHGRAGPRWGRDRSDGEGAATAVHPRLQAEDRLGG